MNEVENKSALNSCVKNIYFSIDINKKILSGTGCGANCGEDQICLGLKYTNALNVEVHETKCSAVKKDVAIC